MRTLPARSPGLMLASFQGDWAVYDLLNHRVTLVSALAGKLLCAPATDLDDLVDEIRDATGVTGPDDRQQIDDGLRAAGEALVDAGLLGRSEAWEPPAPVVFSTQPEDGALVGPSQAVLDERLAFRSTETGLLDDIDRLLQATPTADPPTVIFDVEPTDSGGVTLHAPETWDFPDFPGFEVQLPGVINHFAARTNKSLVLHTGAVRTPEGRVILVVGLPEAGKSTLTAALAALGSDYLGDELIGVRADSLQAVGFPRALALDANSCHLLEQVVQSPIASDGPYVPVAAIRKDCRSIEGEGGPVTEIVLPHLDRSLATVQTETLTPRAALEELLPSVMNLTRCGESGWRALCQLAERVPIRRLHHPNAVVAARFLLE